MKVAIVTSEFVSENNFDGGLANYNYKLARLLMERNVEVAVFVGTGKNEDIVFEGIPVYRVDAAGYDKRIYASRLFGKSYTKFKRFMKARTSAVMAADLRFQSRILCRRLREVNKEMHFDIVHFSALAGVGIYRDLTLPAIARISSSTVGCHEAGGYGERDAVIYRQEKIELKALRKMDAVFGPSKMVAGIISKQIGKEIEIIETPYMFPTGELDDTVFRENLQEKKYVLFFGSVGLIKGCGTIAEIIGSFLHEHPDHYFVFVGKILGSSVSGVNMLDHLKAKAGVNADRIIHFGKMPHEKLFPLIRNAAFVALPSRMDNFPNTCVESMGLGKIVIGTNGNGFDQMIVNGENGFLINVDDSTALLRTMKTIVTLSDSEKREIGNKALQRVELLKPSVIADQLLDFYSDTIKKFKSR